MGFGAFVEPIKVDAARFMKIAKDANIKVD